MIDFGEVFKGFLGKKDSTPTPTTPQKDLNAELASAMQAKEDFNKQSSMDPVRADLKVGAELDEKIEGIRNELASNNPVIQPTEGGLDKIMEATRVNTTSPEPTTPNMAEPTPLHPETGVQTPPAQPVEEKAA